MYTVTMYGYRVWLITNDIHTFTHIQNFSTRINEYTFCFFVHLHLLKTVYESAF
jgi:hypothetical protein